MNRREFGLGAAATVVAAVVPQLPETWKRMRHAEVWKSSRGNVITETQLVENNAYFKDGKLIWDHT
jgi:hypothetical protein